MTLKLAEILVKPYFRPGNGLVGYVDWSVNKYSLRDQIYAS